MYIVTNHHHTTRKKTYRLTRRSRTATVYDSMNLIHILHMSRTYLAPLAVSVLDRHSVHQPIPLSPHKVPNIMLAKNGERDAVRVFFPRLYSKERKDVCLTQDEMRDWYNKGIRPAAMEICPESAGDFPPSYNAELFRASKANGGFALGSKPLPGWSAVAFTNALRRHLSSNHVNWAEGMLFQLQVKGMKGASYHACDIDAASDALEVFLQDYNTDAEGEWFIDVGLEFSIPGRALQWRTDSHYHFINYLFTNRLAQQYPTPEFVQSLTTLGSKYYARDLSSHLAELSGCRCDVLLFTAVVVIVIYSFVTILE